MTREAWAGRAACRTGPEGLDLTELTQENAVIARGHREGWYDPYRDAPVRVYAEDLQAARFLCSGCPVLAMCRRDLLDPRGFEVPGFAGGMTEVERADRRGARSSRRLVKARREEPAAVAPEQPALPDISPTTVGELLEATATQPALDLPGFEAPLPQLKDHGVFRGPVQQQVVRLTAAGLTSAEVAAQLQLKRTQVRYLLQREHGSKRSVAS